MDPFLSKTYFLNFDLILGSNIRHVARPQASLPRPYLALPFLNVSNPGNCNAFLKWLP
jgi:hypothetical protein